MNRKRKTEVAGFSQEWLALREPADHAARSSTLNDDLVAWASQKTPIQVLDLGTGTGSNVRYLSPLLGFDQQWTLVDNDPQLLAQLPDILLRWGESNSFVARRSGDTVHVSAAGFSAAIRWRQTDLAGALASLPFAVTSLVTGSALLDLTSRPWLDQLASLCLEHSCASFFVLNYDGRIQWQPGMDEDSAMAQRLNAHQRTDKGFGEALGPQAGQYLVRQLRGRQAVKEAASDWLLGAQYLDLQSALIDGWSSAAAEQDALAHAAIRRWQAARAQSNASGQSNLMVGHIDVLALPFG